MFALRKDFLHNRLRPAALQYETFVFAKTGSAVSRVREKVQALGDCEGSFAQKAQHLPIPSYSLKLFAELYGGGIVRLPGGGGQCSVCGRSFSGLRNAKRHFSTVHMQENSPCTCPVCKKPFIRKELMKDHLRRKHKMYKDTYKALV